MFKIREARKLAEKIFFMEVEAPRVAKACQPGEFIIVRVDEKGERIPLTICDYNREEGTICIVFQTVGYSTERMAALKAGDSFADVTGPLGNPSEFVHEDLETLQSKKLLFIAGGVGTAPVYPQVKWLHEHGVEDVYKRQVIDDTYNASPASVKSGVDVLMQLDNPGRKIAVLGDILELGDISRQCHYDTGTAIADVYKRQSKDCRQR